MTQGTVDSIEILPMSTAMTDEALEARDSFLNPARAVTLPRHYQDTQGVRT